MRIAQLEQVEAARKEVERVRLQAEYVAAISEVYVDVIKEDEEPFFGSEDPDLDDKTEPYETEASIEPGRSISGKTFVMESESVNPRATVLTDVKLEYPSEPAREQFEDILSKNGRISSPNCSRETEYCLTPVRVQ